MQGSSTTQSPCTSFSDHRPITERDSDNTDKSTSSTMTTSSNSHSLEVVGTLPDLEGEISSCLHYYSPVQYRTALSGIGVPHCFAWCPDPITLSPGLNSTVTSLSLDPSSFATRRCRRKRSRSKTLRGRVSDLTAMNSLVSHLPRPLTVSTYNS